MKEFKIKDYTAEIVDMITNNFIDTGIIETGANITYQQSSNYVPNVSGWKLFGDGTAQVTGLVVTGGTISYNKTSFADAANAGYYISSDGIYFGAAADATKLKYNIGTGALDFVGTISSKSTADIVAAFGSGANASNIVTNLVNARIDSSTKEILSDFTFGASGAIRMNTDATNGLWLSPTGILGKKAGVTTFAIDTSGNASFRGDVVITGGSGIASLTDAGALATEDTIGSGDCDSTIISGGKIITGLLTADNIQAGTLTGRTVRTSSSGARCQLDGSNNIISIFDATRERVRMNQENIYFYNSSGNTTGKIYTVGGNAILQIEATTGNYLILNAPTSYTIAFQNAGSEICNVNTNGITMASGKKISTPKVNYGAAATNPSSAGDFVNYASGGTDQFRGIPGDGAWAGSFDMTAY